MTAANGPDRVYDANLVDLDVPAAITAGLSDPDEPRRLLFGAAAVAASRQAEGLGVGPYPLRFLAQHIRSAGRVEAAALPEPLIGAEPTALARRWIAAAGAEGGVVRDDLFARWLDEVAALIALRRRAGDR